jgi:hypothetical protein
MLLQQIDSIRSPIPEKVKIPLRSEKSLFILAGLFWGEFLPISSPHFAFFAGLLFVVIGIASFVLETLRENQSLKCRVFIFALSIAFFLLLVFPYAWQPEARISILASILLVLALVTQQHSRQTLYRVLGITFFAGVIFLLMWRGIPAFREVLCNFSLQLTAQVSYIGATERTVSFSLSGLLVLLVFLVLLFIESGYAIAANAPKEDRTNTKKLLGHSMLKAIALIGVWFVSFRWGIYLLVGIVRVLNAWFYSVTEGVTWRLDLFTLELYSSSLLMFIGGLLLDFILPTRIPKHPSSENNMKVLPLKSWFISAICSILVILAFLAVLGIYSPEYVKVDSSKSQEVFLTEGKLSSFTVADFEQFGIISGGMFGMLNRYLEAQNYICQTGTLEEWLEKQPPTDILAIINPTELLSSVELKKIYDFVVNGGSLLVLGDHTDLMGSQKPLNQILKPVGIEFEFTSAFTARHWYYAYETFPSYLTYGLDRTNERLQQSTGASLTIVRPQSVGEVAANSRYAVSIVNGRYSFADLGNYNNPDGYLGDYLYQYGESVGDLCVIAQTQYGRGKILIFGDTSMFQHVAMPRSLTFVSRVFDLLSGKSLVRERMLGIGRVLWTSLAAGLLFLIVFLLYPKYTFVAPIIIPFALIMVHLLQPPSYRDYDIPNIISQKHPLALVDASHVNLYNREFWTKYSIAGLTTNLARNGYLPALKYSSFTKYPLHLQSASLIAIVGPLKDFNHTELETLNRFMEEGGTVILATGWQESQFTPELLAHFGIRFQPTPLGPQPVVPKTTDTKLIQEQFENLHFLNLWPWEFSNDYQVIHQELGYAVIITRKFDKGRLIAIGDSNILVDKGIEQERDYWKGNILWFRDLLKKYVARQPESSKNG